MRRRLEVATYGRGYSKRIRTRGDYIRLPADRNKTWCNSCRRIGDFAVWFPRAASPTIPARGDGGPGALIWNAFGVSGRQGAEDLNQGLEAAGNGRAPYGRGSWDRDRWSRLLGCGAGTCGVGRPAHNLGTLAQLRRAVVPGWAGNHSHPDREHWRADEAGASGYWVPRADPGNQMAVASSSWLAAIVEWALLDEPAVAPRRHRPVLAA